MKQYTLTEEELKTLIAESTKAYLVNEGLWNGIKQGAKTAGLGALGAAGLMGLDLANSELNSDEVEDPITSNVRQATDEFRYDNLMDKVNSGEISYEDAMNMYDSGKGYANESRRISGKLKTESFKKSIRRIIEQVIKEESGRA